MFQTRLNSTITQVSPDQPVPIASTQLHAQPGATLSIDLPAQTVTDVAGSVHRFEIDSLNKSCLIEGISQIALTLRHRDAIDAFERRYRETVSRV